MYTHPSFELFRRLVSQHVISPSSFMSIIHSFTLLLNLFLCVGVVGRRIQGFDHRSDATKRTDTLAQLKSYQQSKAEELSHQVQMDPIETMPSHCKGRSHQRPPHSNGYAKRTDDQLFGFYEVFPALYRSTLVYLLPFRALFPSLSLSLSPTNVS